MLWFDVTLTTDITTGWPDPHFAGVGKVYYIQNGRQEIMKKYNELFQSVDDISFQLTFTMFLFQTLDISKHLLLVDFNLSNLITIISFIMRVGHT